MSAILPVSRAGIRYNLALGCRLDRRSLLRVISGSFAAPWLSGKAAPVLPVFANATARSRITFLHRASRTSQKYLPESMSGGVAMFDYNNDGRLDLFFVNGALLRDPMPAGAQPDKSDPK